MIQIQERKWRKPADIKLAEVSKKIFRSRPRKKPSTEDDWEHLLRSTTQGSELTRTCAPVEIGRRTRYGTASAKPALTVSEGEKAAGHAVCATDQTRNKERMRLQSRSFDKQRRREMTRTRWVSDGPRRRVGNGGTQDGLPGCFGGSGELAQGPLTQVLTALISLQLEPTDLPTVRAP